MKEVYVEAQMEIIEFECEDIITGSNDTPIAPYGLVDEYGNLIE